MKTVITKAEVIPALTELVRCGFKFKYTSKVSRTGRISRYWLISDTGDTKWILLQLGVVVGKRKVVTLSGHYKALGFDSVKDVGGMDAVSRSTTYTML